MVHRSLLRTTLLRSILVVGAFLLALLFAGTHANAARVHFRYVGGRWSHGRHAGWHHYWGGPTIGFYWAPEPVYIVRGYEEPRYYYGPDYWYSNPSFGLSLNFGGGGYRRGWQGGRDRYYRGYGSHYGHRYFRGEHRR